MDRHRAVPTALMARAAGSGKISDTTTTRALYTTTPEMPFTANRARITATARPGRWSTNWGMVFRSSTPVSSRMPKPAAHSSISRMGR